MLAERFIEDYAKPHKRSWRDDARQLRTMVPAAVEEHGRPRTSPGLTCGRCSATSRRTRGGVTANRLRALLSKLFRWAVSQDYLPANPAVRAPEARARNVALARALG